MSTHTGDFADTGSANRLPYLVYFHPFTYSSGVVSTDATRRLASACRRSWRGSDFRAATPRQLGAHDGLAGRGTPVRRTRTPQRLRPRHTAAFSRRRTTALTPRGCARAPKEWACDPSTSPRSSLPRPLRTTGCSSTASISPTTVTASYRSFFSKHLEPGGTPHESTVRLLRRLFGRKEKRRTPRFTRCSDAPFQEGDGGRRHRGSERAAMPVIA